jgi:uncharacterized protein (DUF2126 family)
MPDWDFSSAYKQALNQLNEIEKQKLIKAIEGVKPMDIQIKRKEVDKKAKLRELVPNVHGNIHRDALIDAIDKLYKEESKEIEGVEIRKGDMFIWLTASELQQVYSKVGI